MCRYSPKIDLVFRKLFGSEENKGILLSFINSILEQETIIKDLTIKNPYNLAEYISGKESILDIKAVDENGIYYDIEMQIGEQGYYGKRALYYWSKIYSSQIERAENYTELSKTIGIHLLDFDYFNDERYIRRILLKDFDTNEIYKELDYEELYFIEMSKFKKGYGELKTVLDRWITFMNKAYEFEKGKVPKELDKEKEINEAIEKLEIMYFDEKEREIYEGERKRKMNYNEEIRTAEEKGIEKGIERGMEKIAYKMLKKNDKIEEIVEMTGLSIEKIKEIKNEIKNRER